MTCFSFNHTTKCNVTIINIFFNSFITFRFGFIDFTIAWLFNILLYSSKKNKSILGFSSTSNFNCGRICNFNLFNYRISSTSFWCDKIKFSKYYPKCRLVNAFIKSNKIWNFSSVYNFNMCNWHYDNSQTYKKKTYFI